MGSEKDGTVANIYNPHSPSFLHNNPGQEMDSGGGEFNIILSLAEK
jgi:hypothetical protein